MSNAEQAASGFDHRTFLASVTRRPGVYVMFDNQAQVLYVGKARNLHNRLASYFRGSGLTAKTLALVNRIHQIQVTVTGTENEALILEQNLIKQYRPQYNILLRDDKSYPYIHVATEHPFPRLELHRGARSGPGRYYGPYPSAGAVRESLSLLQKVFKVRQCEDSYYSNRTRPCLQYQINRCTAPCVGYISEEDYAEDVRRTMLFLEGKSSELIAELADAMEQAAARQDYERAAELRDQIGYLRQIQASQSIEGEVGDLDIIAAVQQGGQACVQLLGVRGGRVLGSRSYFPRCQLDEDTGQLLEAFIAQYYLTGSGQEDPPRELVLNNPLPDERLLARALSEGVGRQVSITSRVRGQRAQWLQLAVSAAEQNLGHRLADKVHYQARCEALQEALALPEPPQRMECFDISHSSGEATVASCVVFDQNGPLKSDYRRFNIGDITPGDDYAAMQQALTRRYQRIKSGESPLPDILFVDGGKGQVSHAREVLDSLQIRDVLLIGVAKGSDRRPGMETLIREDGHAFSLPAHSAALHLVQQIRDEAHRFAVSGHKTRRDKRRRQSTLEDIPGVGPRRRRELLRHFGGLQGIRKASIADLCRVPGISDGLARTIHEQLNSR